MRREKKWRYYCDFCKKSGASGGHMKNHEKSCCRNPERVCGMCGHATLAQQPIKDLIAALGPGDKDGVDKVRDLSEGCPACMLAAIMQSGVQEPEEDGTRLYVEFDFKKEQEGFWSEVASNAMDFDQSV